MGDKKFRAFISYSHADERWGAWLQRSLERFRAPADLARRIAAEGRSARLSPVFRDREDLPVAGNLNEAIQKALADSEFQIVLCSPNAAKSRWVNEEIKLFNRLHGPGRTFAIIVAGAPGGGEAECFPPALRFRLGPDGEPTTEPHEPLAADAREEGDGKRHALLKTAAGMLGVGLDDLIRREARARARRMQATVAATSGITAFMTFAAIFAINQRNEARAMRGKAETLVEFMLSDLSDRLEPVGQLGILEAVGGEVLSYYEGQDIRALDPPALSRRAKALMKLGSVDMARGDIDAAFKAYQAAFASTGEQLRRAPNDPDRIFDHAQSVFYLGEAARKRGDDAEMEARNLDYFRFAQRLVELAPEDPRSRIELAYAYSNLGAVKFEQRKREESIPLFEKSIEIRRALAEERPDDRKIATLYAYGLSWLGYAELMTGRHARSAATYQLQFEIYDRLLKADEDYTILNSLVSAQRRFSNALLNLGRIDEAKAAIDAARASADKLLQREPDNTNSIVNASHIARAQSYLAGLAGDAAAAARFAEEAIAFAADYQRKEKDSAASGSAIAFAEARHLLISPADASRARKVAAAREQELSNGKKADLDFIAYATLALSRHAKAAADAASIHADSRPVIDLLDANVDRLSDPHKVTLAMIHREHGAPDRARAVLERITSAEFAHPDFIALRRDLGVVTATPAGQTALTP